MTENTCKRGHERTPENYRERTANVGGKPRIVRECLACAREAKVRKAAAATPPAA